MTGWRWLPTAVWAVCLLPILGLACGGDAADSPAQDPTGSAAEQGAADEQTMRPAELYFPGSDGRLYIEIREVATGAEPVDRLVAVVEALLIGPQTEGLRAPFANDVEVDGLFLLDDSIVALNLRSADGGPPTSTGSLREMLIVYSLVNTVLLDLDAGERLLLTWNGRQLPSFAGQLDLTHPLRPNLDLVAG